MQSVIKAAALLLIIQVGLVFYANTTNKKYEPFSPENSLFTFSPESATSITITDADKQHFTLEKEDDRWLLAVKSRPDADQEQVTQLLEKLAKAKESLALATSKGAAKRFKVSDDLFEHRLVVKEGDKVVVDLYIGTSPGFRQVHARIAGQDNILSLGLDTNELTGSVGNWLDQKMLHVEEKDLQEVQLAAFSLVKKDEQWQLGNVGEDQQQNDEEVKKLISKLCTLTVQTILDQGTVADSKAGEPQLQYSLTLKDKEPISYSFTKSDAGYYILKVSDRAPYFKVQEWVVQNIMDIDRAKLVQVKQPQDQEGPEATSNIDSDN